MNRRPSCRLDAALRPRRAAVVRPRPRAATLLLALFGGASPVASEAADACARGYFGREAYPGDATCVRPDRREAAAADNRAARSRVEPQAGSSGPETCRNGFVWREARPGDVVCVTAKTRQYTADENRMSARYRLAAPAPGAPPGCAASACTARIGALQAQLAEIREKRASKQRQLADAERRRRQTRLEDEARAREQSGLGRSGEPSVADDVTSLRQDIETLDKAYAEAQRQLAAAVRADGAGAARSAPPGR